MCLVTVYGGVRASYSEAWDETLYSRGTSTLYNAVASWGEGLLYGASLYEDLPTNCLAQGMLYRGWDASCSHPEELSYYDIYAHRMCFRGELTVDLAFSDIGSEQPLLRRRPAVVPQI